MRRTCALFLTIVVLVGPGAGCSASSDETNGSGDTGGTTVINITNYEYDPPELTVGPGQDVTFNDNDGVTHTATSDDGTSFDTGEIEPGSSATITIPGDAGGEITYYCTVHPYMKASITVEQ